MRDAKPYLLEALGRRYIRETRVLRSDGTHFIDKMPNNFAHVGLIHAVLPEATIIDVRRHPLDTGLSCYKQYFAAGQAFTADLDGLESITARILRSWITGTPCFRARCCTSRMRN